MSRSALSLHPITAIDASPAELVDIAGRLDIKFVSLFTNVPDVATGRYPAVQAADVPRLKGDLEEAGVALCNLEFFPLDRDGDRSEFQHGLEIGAALGALRATAHIHGVTGEQQAADRFGAFAAIAGAFGIEAGLEFNHFSAVRDVRSAARVVRAAGRGSIVLDILHLLRSNGSAADVRDNVDLIGYVQLSDGPAHVSEDARWREALNDRLPPGRGQFPLLDLLAPLPSGTIFEAEVPQRAAMKLGVSAFDRARLAIEATRAVLEKVHHD